MLKEEKKATWVPQGWWIFKTWQLCVPAAPEIGPAGPFAGVIVGDEDYKKMLLDQEERPFFIEIVPITASRTAKYPKKYWMFRGRIYSTDQDLNATEVKALLIERELRNRRRIERAVSLMNMASASPAEAERRHIPDAVKEVVWRRDRGRCVRCGTTQRLEFDHIIPLARGGSSTPRNIQLLCESCNRAKGDSLV